jgi:Fe-S oxidoreductase
MSQAWLLIAATALALAITIRRLLIRFRPVLAARASARHDQLGRRFGGALLEFGLHSRLRRSAFAGSYHAVIVASFLILLASKVHAFAEILSPESDVLRWALPAHDVAAAAMLAAVFCAILNRLWFGQGRFAGSNQRDAAIILVAITAIVLASEAEAVVHAAARPDDAGLLPLASAIATLFPTIRPEFASGAEVVLRWLHVSAILAFLVYIPGSKHLHVLTGIPNLVFRNLGPRGQLRQETEVLAPANTIATQSWKGLFDLYSCSECGRCQAVCPAYASGAPLSPKSLIMTLRDELVSTAFGKASPQTPLAGQVIDEQALWACTSCYACMAACPLHIEHLPRIVELRRGLIEDGRLDPALTATLNGGARQGNVLKKPARQRAAWTEGLDFTIPDARDEEVEYLWFVGDHASYHPAVARKTRQFARLLKAANVSFGLVHAAERNSGNDIRRIGEEDLFQELVRQNIETLAACRYKTLVTTDPHSFNTLLNEYPAFGLQAKVVHHTELLAELMACGGLSPQRETLPRRLTYHDPCYLGRYNGRYEPARAIIERCGHHLIEMPRNKENTFCCGAGGGRIFMTGTFPGPRPAELRLREAAGIEGLEWFVVACPKDYVMFLEASKSVDLARKIAVKDITDLFFEDAAD